GRARHVVEMHPGAVAGTAPDERILSLAHQVDLVIRGARPIERAVAQHRAVGLEHGVLEMADRIRTPAHYRCRLRVERVLFGLHPSALADAVPTSVTLRDEVGYTGRLG